MYGSGITEHAPGTQGGAIVEMLDRRRFIGLGAAGASALLLGGGTAGNSLMAAPQGTQGASPKRPNVLFLFTDDQRFDAIRALGNEEIHTPNMDRLVESGVSFTRAGIMGSTSPAVCLPSRAMLMSGRTLYRAPRDLAGTVTFPELLGQAGYRTFGTGKWHNGRQSFARSFGAGGSIFFGGMSNHLRVPVNDFDPTGAYTKQTRHAGAAFSSELFSNEAVRFLREYDAADPFLMYVSYTAPHDPRMAPKEFADLYPPQDIALPVNFLPEHPFDNGELKIRDEALAPWPRTPEIVREHIAAYYAMVTHLDHHIGRVREALEQSGHADNTIIVFAGDNGLAVGQHGLLGKQNLYEHSVRVPLVFCGPGIPQGERRDDLCYLLDIFPTLCDLTGQTTPDSVEGRTLLPAIRGDSSGAREDLFLAYRNFQRGVRDDRFKLIEYTVKGERNTQLFDLTQDPWETTNLAGKTDHAGDLARLRERLAEWQTEVDDPVLQV